MICPECKIDVLGTVCKKCGTVLKQKLVKRPEKVFNWFPAHKVTSVNLNECNSTELKRILKRDTYETWEDSSLRMMGIEIEKSINQLGSLNKDRVLHFLFKIHRMSKNQDYPLKKKKIYLETTANAILYLYIRIKKLPYTLSDFENLGFDKQEIYSIYSDIVKSLGLFNLITVQNPCLFISRIISQLNLNKKRFTLLQKSAIALSSKVKNLNEKIISKDCYKIGIQQDAAIIYLLTKESQRSISEISGVKIASLWNGIKRIKGKLEVLCREPHIRDDYSECDEFVNNLLEKVFIEKNCGRFLININKELPRISKACLFELSLMG